MSAFPNCKVYGCFVCFTSIRAIRSLATNVRSGSGQRARGIESAATLMDAVEQARFLAVSLPRVRRAQASLHAVWGALDQTTTREPKP
jgi:hypothetical protein